MAIRSYKDFKFTQIDGSVAINSAFSNKWVEGICIYFDDQSIVSKPTTRYICKCGNTFFEEDATCPKCGNKNWTHARIGGRYYYRGRYGRDGDTYYTIPELVNGQMVVPMISVSWDKSGNRFEITESYYELITVSREGFLHLNAVDALNWNKLDEVFNEWIDDNPKWDETKLIENIYPYDHIQKALAIEENKIVTMISLYNLLRSIPNLSTLSPDMFLAVFDRTRMCSRKLYKSLTEFYKDAKIPMAFSDIYAMTGLPSEQLERIDLLDPIVLNTMSYSLTHCHTTFRDLSYIVSSDEAVSKINNNPREFAEFFRKNVIKFAGDTLRAFEYVDGNATIKDANIRKFINYCAKKNIKKDKIENFYNNMYDGNAIKALESLL